MDGEFDIKLEAAKCKERTEPWPQWRKEEALVIPKYAQINSNKDNLMVDEKDLREGLYDGK